MQLSPAIALTTMNQQRIRASRRSSDWISGIVVRIASPSAFLAHHPPSTRTRHRRVDTCRVVE